MSSNKIKSLYFRTTGAPILPGVSKPRKLKTNMVQTNQPMKLVYIVPFICPNMLHSLHIWVNIREKLFYFRTTGIMRPGPSGIQTTKANCSRDMPQAPVPKKEGLSPTTEDPDELFLLKLLPIFQLLRERDKQIVMYTFFNDVKQHVDSYNQETIASIKNECCYEDYEDIKHSME